MQRKSQPLSFQEIQRQFREEKTDAGLEVSGSGQVKRDTLLGPKGAFQNGSGSIANSSEKYPMILRKK